MQVAKEQTPLMNFPVNSASAGSDEIWREMPQWAKTDLWLGNVMVAYFGPFLVEAYVKANGFAHCATSW